MSKRLTVMVMLLALAAVVVPLHANADLPTGPAGIKSSAETESDTPEAPAMTTWGMLATILLVMGASTMTLLGGGIRNAVNTIRGNTPPPVSAPVTPSPAQVAPVAENEAKPEQSLRAKKSPKNKSRRTVAQQRQIEQRRQQMRMVQRGATKAPLRKSGGPGCRGVR